MNFRKIGFYRNKLSEALERKDTPLYSYFYCMYAQLINAQDYPDIYLMEKYDEDGNLINVKECIDALYLKGYGHYDNMPPRPLIVSRWSIGDMLGNAINQLTNYECGWNDFLNQ